jgi:hypothetical protein
MVDEPLDDYFQWLYNKVAAVDIPTPSLTHYTLLRDLHVTEFVWIVSGDDNRAEDGVGLRMEFNRQMWCEESLWLQVGCSVLEMLIALARRAEFQTTLSTRDWFWIFMTNMQLDHLNDAESNISEQVALVLDRVVWRTYTSNGGGGLFPLRTRKRRDQRKIELWYQFCAFLIENET